MPPVEIVLLKHPMKKTVIDETRRRALVVRFESLAGPLVGEIFDKARGVYHLSVFVVKYLDEFQVIFRSPRDVRERRVRAWLTDLATMPPGSYSVVDPSMMRIRGAFGRIPRVRGAPLLSPPVE